MLSFQREQEHNDPLVDKPSGTGDETVTEISNQTQEHQGQNMQAEQQDDSEQYRAPLFLPSFLSQVCCVSGL
jgi:hypothetical protein